MAVLSTLAALLLQQLLGKLIHPTPFILFFGAVMLSGWWGGGGPGLLSVGLSLLAVDYYFLPPFHSFKFQEDVGASLILFAAIATAITRLNVKLRQTNAERTELLLRERQARLDAEAERARLRELFIHAPAHVALFHGPDHIYTLSNPLNDEALGHRQVLGKPLREAIPEAADQGFVALLDRVYATGEPFHAQEMPVKISLQDGTEREFFISFVYQPTRNARGQIDGVATFGFDVTDLVRARTEHRRVEEELRRAEANARFLSEASAVLASSLDYESTLSNVARLAVPMLADWCVIDLAQPDGTLQRVATVCASPEDSERALQVQQLRTTTGGLSSQSPILLAFQQGHSFLIPILTPEFLRESSQTEEFAQVLASARPLSFIAAPLVVRGRSLGVLSFVTSRSGRRYTEVELELLEELARRAALSVENALLYRSAQEAIRLRDEFLSIASHELKTPLTPLSLKLQMLGREARRQPESPFRKAVEDYITVGSRQVKKLSELVSDLLDVARIAGGRLRLEFEEMDLGVLTREVTGRHEPEAARVGSTLVLEAPESVLGTWDRLRLEQVITNLVDNAIKYGAGKPIRIQLETDMGHSILRVKDEGIGIAPENLSRIFERFERAVSERHYGGLGLGLYITRTIVEAMGGRIQVDSTPGQGATFTVVLPRKPREEAPSNPSA